MRKVLIMTASTGGGHNRAAKAIVEELENRKVGNEKIECKIIDSLKLVNDMFDKLISDGYEISAKYTPYAYGKIYSLSEKKFFSLNEFKTNPIAMIMARKLKKLISKERPDLIIGTHAFPLVALSKLKKKEFIFPPLISVLTDYTAHSAYLQNEVDYYVCGDEYVKELLVEEGIPGKKIKPFGIPVEKSFMNSRPRKEVLSEMGLDPQKKTILLMGGSFGAGNIKGTLDELYEIDRDFQIIVIVGRNESLKSDLEEKVYSYENPYLPFSYENKLEDDLNLRMKDKKKVSKIKILGFTDAMNDILSSVDILVTKPGGLTTTEALLKEVPMVIPFFIPGQEAENLDFFTNCGAAVRVTDKFSIKTIIKVLLDNPERLEMIKANIRGIKKLDSSRNIADLTVEIFKNSKVDYSNILTKKSILKNLGLLDKEVR